ncbi:MAG: hypothetical protein HY654_06040, partial [Acidobacteria bacterium]|nr:hypothetical protein [Acidobacteriota bacterium]
FWAGRLLERFLFEIRGFDLTTYLAAAVCVMTLTVIACLLPAARATRLSPVAALRHE